MIEPQTPIPCTKITGGIVVAPGDRVWIVPRGESPRSVVIDRIVKVYEACWHPHGCDHLVVGSIAFRGYEAFASKERATVEFEEDLLRQEKHLREDADLLARLRRGSLPAEPIIATAKEYPT